ncbi:ABC transporter substrate-binding protein [Georgenia alba]|uniref:ABC transporter substrate-binding protein n=1 Tax=Georgenia alba TaxID=2233858 RepID=A0ABW2Q5A3_9MICO
MTKPTRTNPDLSRRGALRLGALGAAVAGAAPILAACDSTSAGGGGGGNGGGAGGGGGNDSTVRVWTWYQEQVDEWPRLKQEFEAANDGITVEIRTFGNADQYLPALQAAVTAGDVPEIFGPHVRALEYGRNGISADLNAELGAEFMADFFPSTNSAFQLDGAQYAVGWMAQTFGVFYNPDLMEAAGVQDEPETWDDLIAAAQLLRESGTTPMAFAASPATSAGDLFLPMLAQVTDDPEFYIRLDNLDGVTYEDPAVVEALTLFKRLSDEGVFQDGAAATIGDQASQLFYTEGAAMFYSGSWNPQGFVQSASPEFVDKYRIMRIPAYSPGARHWTANQAGAALGVAAESPAKEAALEFLRFIYQPDQYAQTMNNSNSMPSTQSAAEQIENEEMQLMTQWLLDGDGVPHIPFGSGSAAALDPLTAVLEQGATPEETATAMQRAVEQARG